MMMKLCECGCGKPTAIAKKTRTKIGHVKGEPVRFRSGHAGPVLSKEQYRVEDCGYKSACWIWLRSKDGLGYGMVHVDKKMVRAHIAAFLKSGGVIPEDHELDHLCRQRACVNPAHLEPVTHVENVRRGRVAKLTRSDVIEIRNLLRSGALSQRAIGEMFGVKQYCISAIHTRRNWRNVA